MSVCTLFFRLEPSRPHGAKIASNKNVFIFSEGFVGRSQCAPSGALLLSRWSKFFCATPLRRHFRPFIDRLILQSSPHGERRRSVPHPARPGPRSRRRTCRARRAATSKDLPRRG